MAEQIEIPAEIAALSFEDALQQLENIVAQLESGNVDLEKSIDIYTRGTQLKAHCEQKLRSAEARIEKLVIGADGTPTGTVPFSGE